MTKLSEIQGIGDVYSSKLAELGISSLQNLLDACASKKGRKEIASKIEVSDKLVLNWMNRADLARVKGISTHYADLLELAGVDTVPELAQRNAENLLLKITELNAEKELVKRLPSLSQVGDWIAQAKELPRVITY